MKPANVRGDFDPMIKVAVRVSIEAILIQHISTGHFDTGVKIGVKGYRSVEIIEIAEEKCDPRRPMEIYDPGCLQT